MVGGGVVRIRVLGCRMLPIIRRYLMADWLSVHFISSSLPFVSLFCKVIESLKCEWNVMWCFIALMVLSNDNGDKSTFLYIIHLAALSKCTVSPGCPHFPMGGERERCKLGPPTKCCWGEGCTVVVLGRLCILLWGVGFGVDGLGSSSVTFIVTDIGDGFTRC